MKSITKDNKGITLIALIIAVIIMLILVSVTTYTGIDTYRYSQVNKFVTQMQLLQTKVDDLVATKTAEELDKLNLELGDKYQNIITNAYNGGNGEISSNIASEYRILTKEQVLSILDVEDVKNDILVNFETREILSTVGLEYEGVTYYTQYKLPGGQTIINDKNEIIRDLSFILTETIDGLNATITISGIEITNGTLSYREIGENYWNVINNYTEKGKDYSVVVSKSTTYEFKLTDNATGENSNIKVKDETTDKEIEIVPDKNKEVVIVTNKPKTENQLEEYNYALTSEKWAYTQKDSINYLWIPRFAYKTNAETNSIDFKFVKGNSNIATDNTYVDNTWSIHEKFATDVNLELTGIWVSVSEEEMEQPGLNMITVLNDNSREILIEI